MNITVINGSPKGKNSNTNIIINSLLKGAAEAGAQTTNIFLSEKDINHCTGCTTCWVKHPGQCIINDDMLEIISKLGTSNIIALATPIYFENVTSLFKAFIDRLTMIMNPHSYSSTTYQEIPKPQETKSQAPKLMMISNCGYPDKNNFEVLAHWYNRFVQNMHSESAGEIYVTQGKYLASPPENMKLAVLEYLRIIETAGKEITINKTISIKTRQLLDTPFATEYPKK
jgi:multimeric flavodoxin WrbA